ncbi:MAG: hypothetical protein IKS48_10955 [Eubacterium sp.]|nr:hypothetical protein [Eubacterium sp.]
MSDLKKKTIEYLLDVPKIIVLAIPLIELILYLNLFETNRLFALSYLLIFVEVYGFLKVLGRDKLYLLFSTIILLALGLIFRDIVLFENMLLAYFPMLLIYILNIPSVRRIGWAVAAVVECGLWIYFWDMSKPVAICLVLIVILGIVEFLKKDIRYYLPALLIIGMIVLFIPVNDEPIKWTFIRNTAEKISTVVSYVGDEIGYHFRGLFGDVDDFTGYAETGKLQGVVRSTSQEEISYEIFGTCRDSSIHLKGADYSRITPEGMLEKQSTDMYYNAGFIQFMNAIYQAGIDQKKADCIIKVESGDFVYRYLRTEDIICPLMPIFVAKISEDGDRNIELSESDMTKVKKKNFRYHVQYLTIDYGSPYYKELLLNMNSDDFKYVDYYTIVQYVRDILNLNIANRISKQRYDDIVNYLENKETNFETEGYLDTSMSTQRIHDLSTELTADCESDYEKAKRIEYFLRQYKYNRKTDLRGSENYVDDFLFETKRGYCVHYASAMIIMLRECGIPSRYANGFVHRFDEEKMKVRGEVMSNDAHAWPEAYIKGIGWIPLEPTTIIKMPEQDSWGLKYTQTDEETGSETDAELRAGGDHFPGPDDIPEQYRKYYEQSNDVTPTEVKERNSGKDLAYKLLYYTVAILGTVLMLFLLIKLIRWIWYMRLSPEMKLQENINSICKTINKKNVEGKKIESIYDYLDFFEDEAERERLKDIFNQYYKVRFRGDVPDEELIKTTRRFWDEKNLLMR